MQAATIRRLMVFGVCLLGVGALYLVPSVARPPGQVAAPARPDDAPTVKRSSRPGSPVPSTITTTAYDEPETWPSDQAPTSAGSTEAPEASEPPAGDEADRQPAEPGASAARRTGSTPFEPGAPEDITPPTPVTALELDEATPERLRLVWAPSTDDSGVVSYRVWLNGYPVRTTIETTATLDWFNNDDDQHVVLVHAIDPAGNQSLNPATLLVARPTPSPSPRPAETPSSTATTPPATPPAPSEPSAPTPDATSSGAPSPSESPLVDSSPDQSSSQATPPGRSPSDEGSR